MYQKLVKYPNLFDFLKLHPTFIISDFRKSEIVNLFDFELRLKEKFEKVKESLVNHDIISIVSTATGLSGIMVWRYGNAFL